MSYLQVYPTGLSRENANNQYGYLAKIKPFESLVLRRLAQLIESLGDWRRTHYSSRIRPELDGQTVTVFGWVTSIRRQGGITFIILEDREGMIQVTSHKEGEPPDLRKKIALLRPHYTLAVKGKVKHMARAPNEAEIAPTDLRILAVPRKTPPFAFYRRKLPAIDKRLDERAIDLRRPLVRAIFRIRQTVISSIRSFLAEKSFFEVNTPKIIATATEGGAALFPLLYYDKEAFLAQSPQLYKEQLTLAFEKVFEIAPIFRAEQFRTLRHLSETVSVDLEEAYVDYGDVMRILEGMMVFVIENVRSRNRQDLDLIEVDLPPPSLPLSRLPYTEVVDALRREGLEIEWGEDLSLACLRALEEKYHGLYFITDWPTLSKPFYIKPHESDEKLSESFDMMWGSLEIASGGTRVSSKSLLTDRLRVQGLKPQSFQFHLRIFDYGIPPHAGFGLGLERLMMAVTRRENIREVSFFPRDQRRLVP